MRGTLRVGLVYLRRGGIIPAYAGNTHYRKRLDGRARDHPRVCGEHDHHLGVVPVVQGSSPRMRGTLDAVAVGQAGHGIIPAYAGNT